MKSFKLKPALLAVAVLSVSAYTGLASAHCFNGELLGTARDSEDLYHVMCGAGTTRLVADVNLQAGAGSGGSPVITNAIKLQIAKNGLLPSVVVADTVAGGGYNTSTCAALGTDSPSATLNGGVGEYDILVDKTGSDIAKTYGINFHCQDAAGNHTLTVEPLVGSNVLTIGSPALVGDIDMLIDQ